MINRVTEELRNIWGCLDEEQPLCGALAHFDSVAGMALTCADFCADSMPDFYGGGTQDFSRSRRMATAKMTAPKPLQDKALSKGGGG